MDLFLRVSILCLCRWSFRGLGDNDIYDLVLLVSAEGKSQMAVLRLCLSLKVHLLTILPMFLGYPFDVRTDSYFIAKDNKYDMVPGTIYLQIFSHGGFEVRKYSVILNISER